MWQDWILSGAQIIFVISLLPTILHAHQKPPLLTSIPTTVALVAVTIAYVSLSLWWGALAASFLTLGWTILAFQRHKLDARAKKEP